MKAIFKKKISNMDRDIYGSKNNSSYSKKKGIFLTYIFSSKIRKMSFTI